MRFDSALTGGDVRGRHRLLIDDGTLTDIAMKGDGVKSLAALALLKHSWANQRDGVNAVLALEEPESHLHPEAIRALRDVVFGLSESGQVVVSTHSPILVNRSDVTKNILVEGGTSRPARKMSEIRDLLGIRPADDLDRADSVLLVEGLTDVSVLQRVLGIRSARLHRALGDGRLAVVALRGAPKLGYHVSWYRELLCSVRIFIDWDDEGRSAVERAIADGRIEQSDVGYAAVPGMRHSELEDMIRADVYAGAIRDRWGVDLTSGNVLRSRTAKWSDRVKRAFEVAGRAWEEDEVKQCVARQARESAVDPIDVEREAPITSLVNALEHLVSQQSG